jgi:hypothetical protein
MTSEREHAPQAVVELALVKAHGTGAVTGADDARAVQLRKAIRQVRASRRRYHADVARLRVLLHGR